MTDEKCELRHGAGVRFDLLAGLVVVLNRDAARFPRPLRQVCAGGLKTKGFLASFRKGLPPKIQTAPF